MAHNHQTVGKKIVFGSAEYWAMALATEETLEKAFPEKETKADEKPKEDTKPISFFKKKK